MSAPHPVLVIQNNWVYWTKASRGADRPVQRPRLDGPAPLGALPPAGAAVWRHDRFALEDQDFEVRHVFRAGEPPTHCPDVQRGGDILIFRRRGEAWELRLSEPREHTRQTRWPKLPSPLRTLTPGDFIRIDWNARARRSLFGSHRGSFFEEHAIFIAYTSRPSRDLFLNAEPVKHYDFTTKIY